MADTSHLERMGRELKCPICLSLLKSAVSLTCNHVFCNPCIVKSMKSVSTCPVCKVPYRRREIRPAPHMDNLVNVYKSMEDASGINIFVSQNAPSSKLSDETQVEVDKKSPSEEIRAVSQDRGETGKVYTRRNTKRLFASFEDSITKSVKPSFPGKKRVHVPQSPFSETPLRTLKGGMGNGERADTESLVTSQKPYSADETNEPALSPFFWLREDKGEEELSQPTDDDQAMGTPLMNAPTFSDIIESDDEGPSNSISEGKAQNKSNAADWFDSEMFEWTQRPCSPELCSSPSKLQVADTEDLDENQQMELDSVLQCVTTNRQKASAGTAEANVNKKAGSSSKRYMNGGINTQRKRKKKNNELLDVHVGPSVVANSLEKQKNDRSGSFENPENPNLNMAKEVGNHGGILQSSPERLLNLTVSRGELDAISLACMPTPSRDENCFRQDFGLGTLQSSETLMTGSSVKYRVRSKSRNSYVDSELEYPSSMKKQKKELPASELIQMALPTVEDKVSDSDGESCKRARSRSSAYKKCMGASRGSKKSKVSFDLSVNKVACDDSKDNAEIAAAKEISSSKRTGHSHPKDLADASAATKPSASSEVLRKCKKVTTSGNIACAFCHSAEVSEVSGEMVHYLKGQPVQAGHNEGCDIIHSHKNCAEWAPNVYFEDVTAINLEAELARSRRIKCSLCGDKGAALGCYEKSCRKSFHYPCVKLIPQCRWDTDNFVMLCPAHSSSKLPNEVPSPQHKEKKQHIAKGQSQVHQAQAAFTKECTSTWHLSSSSSAAKLVICCSALTATEREIVSEFQRVSRVPVLKKWDPSVTHVIASTDENGACRRTLKVLKGILEGKWILKIEWIKECMKATKLIIEEQYEIKVDIHGIKNGPHLGRLRLLNKQPKLFDGLKFYFAGDFVSSYKGYLQDLVIAAGGIVLHRKPLPIHQECLSSQGSKSFTFIVYSLEPPEKCDPTKKELIIYQRQIDAEALSCSSGAQVTTNLWVLNSIAACKLQSLSA